MKMYFRYALMAVLTVGLSFAVTSCKDDDNSENNSENNGENMEQLESTGGEVSMEDIQLSTLISNFAEVQADELLAQSGWQSKTYEATLGLVLDESRPTVRTIEVGTLDAADERAEAMLRELGIDGQSPSGFTFSSASVGTVSYQHGGGTDANTLAVVNLDVRQLPGISQLRMVKALPANDGTFGYYGRGDIVQKNGRLWICTRPAAKRGDFAYFVSFWTNHRTDNCRWGTYKDMVYLAKDEMASETDLISWLHNFVMSENNYNLVIKYLREKGLSAYEDFVQLVPANNDERRELIKRLHFRLDSLPVAPLAMPEWIERNKWGDTPKANGRYCAPRSLLLANKFRYAIDPCRYWVPFIGWATLDEATDIKNELSNMKTQNAVTNSNHFQFDVSTVVDILDNQTKQDFGGADKCQYVVAAVYWTHNYYDSNQWAMFDFTKDWNQKLDVNNDNIDDISPWLSRNIVSGTLKFQDNGEANASVQKVWVAREDAKLEEKEEDKNDERKIHKDEVKLYSIIGTNGQFYDKVQDARDAGTKPMAIVTYLGETKCAERGKAWNGLAMALDRLPKKYQYTDDDHYKQACQPATFRGEQADKDFTGWETTQTLIGGCGKGHDHQAAKVCNTYGADSLKLTARQTEFSSWFLPSFGQWVATVRAMGVNYYYESETMVRFVGNGTMEKGFTNAGVPNLWEYLKMVGSSESINNIWSSTAADAQSAYAFQNTGKYTINDIFNHWAPYQSDMNYVIPFIAFKYAGGGTIDQ
jgi:hypothetical protein